MIYLYEKNGKKKTFDYPMGQAPQFTEEGWRKIVTPPAIQFKGEGWATKVNAKPPKQVMKSYLTDAAGNKVDPKVLEQ